MTTPTPTDDTGEAIRALVRRLLRPRVAAALAAEQEEAVAPLLGADIAAMLRRLPDRDLLALCAPELRRRLGLDEEEPASAPVAVERHVAPAAPPVRRRKAAPSAPPVLTEDEAAALAPERLNAPAEEGLVAEVDPADAPSDPALEEIVRVEFDPADEEPRLPPLAPVEAELLGDNAHRFELALPAPPPRKLPVLPATPAVPAPSRLAAPVQLEAVPVEQLTSGAERFRCQPFAAVLTAGTCVQRQHDAKGTWARSSAGVKARSLALIAATCKDCALGRSVAAQLRKAAA